jgi:Tetracyclin repressor-like, C-terminal domain
MTLGFGLLMTAVSGIATLGAMGIPEITTIVSFAIIAISTILISLRSVSLGRAALDRSRSRYQRVAPTAARGIVLTRKPRMFPLKAHRYAEITVQMVRALLWLYVETEPPEREALVAEMKSALVNYLSPRLA